MEDVWAIIGLMGSGILLLLAEMVIPGGIVGVVGLIFIACGIVAGFMCDPTVGMILLITCGFALAAGFWAWVRFFPGSRMGKRMFLQGDAKEWRGFSAANSELLGKRGVTHTVLRPSGIAIIGEERIDVVSEGGIIGKAEPVEVVRVEGNRIVVARIEDMSVTT